MENESFVVKVIHADKSQTQLLLEGLLVIKNTAIIKTEFLSALNISQNLEVILKNVIKIDIAFLQLLIALQKSASSVQKKISFNIESTNHMKLTIENSGLENHLPFNFNA